VDLVGLQYVALGSDFDGAVLAHFDVTGLLLIVEALLVEGFNASEIAMIMGGNVKTFLLKNLPA
jgi:membrane dipeptidase